jgi:WD40 repeat protein
MRFSRSVGFADCYPIGSDLLDCVSAAVRHDGRALAHTVVTESDTRDAIEIWNTETGQRIGRRLTGHNGEITALAFTPDGNTLVSVSDDGTTRLWDVPHA